jgi:hypothetical protein
MQTLNKQRKVDNSRILQKLVVTFFETIYNRDKRITKPYNEQRYKGITKPYTTAGRDLSS